MRKTIIYSLEIFHSLTIRKTVYDNIYQHSDNIGSIYWNFSCNKLPGLRYRLRDQLIISHHHHHTTRLRVFAEWKLSNFGFCFSVVFWTVVAVQRPSRRLHRLILFFTHLTVHIAVFGPLQLPGAIQHILKNQLQHPRTQHKETKAQCTTDIWIGK